MTLGHIPVESARLIDAYADRLREFAAFAYQVRSEGVSGDDVASDPRVEELSYRLALLGGELDDAFEAELGVYAPVDQAYEPDGDGDAEDDGELDGLVDPDVDELSLQIYVVKRDEPEDALLTWFDTAGEDLVRRILAEGYEVVEWGCARAPAVLADADDDVPDGD